MQSFTRFEDLVLAGGVGEEEGEDDDEDGPSSGLPPDSAGWLDYGQDEDDVDSSSASDDDDEDAPAAGAPPPRPVEVWFDPRGLPPRPGQGGGELEQELRSFRAFLESAFNPARWGRVAAPSTARQHVRRARFFATYAAHVLPQEVRCLREALAADGDRARRLLTGFAETMSPRWKSATLAGYLATLLQVRAMLWSELWRARLYPDVSRWLGNLHRQALAYAAVEGRYAPTERPVHSLWDLQSLLFAAVADYLHHYPTDRLASAEAGAAASESAWPTYRARVLRPARVALLCLTLTPPVSRSYILRHLEFGRSLERDAARGAWCLSLTDPLALSSQQNKTRATYGGYRLPRSPNSWPAERFIAIGRANWPQGFRVRDGWGSALDFCLLDLQQRVLPGLLGQRQGGGPLALFPRALKYQTRAGWSRHAAKRHEPLNGADWAAFFRQACEHYASQLKVDDRDFDTPAGWSRHLTPKNTRPGSETMLRNLETQEAARELGLSAAPGQRTAVTADDLAIFAFGSQHSARTVERSYLLPSYFEERARKLVAWVDSGLRDPNWQATWDEQKGRAKVTRSAGAQKLCRQFSLRGPALEPLPPADAKRRARDRAAVRELRGYTILNLHAQLGTGEATQHVPAPLPPPPAVVVVADDPGFDVVGFQQVRSLPYQNLARSHDAFWRRQPVEARSLHATRAHTARTLLGTDTDTEEEKEARAQELKSLLGPPPSASDWQAAAQYQEQYGRLLRDHREYWDLVDVHCRPPLGEVDRKAWQDKLSGPDVAYVFRFRLRDRAYGPWPDRWTEVHEVLASYGKKRGQLLARGCARQRLAVQCKLQAYLDALRVLSAQRLAGRDSGVVLVKWASAEPERTEGYDPAKFNAEYWGPWYDRNWSLLPVALLARDYERRDWTLSANLLAHSLGVHGTFALYLPLSVVEEVRRRAGVGVPPPAGPPGAAAPAPAAARQGAKKKAAGRRGAGRGAAAPLPE